MDQQREVDIFLNDKGTIPILLCWATNNRLDLTNRFNYSDALASVGVLSWLDNPSVLWSPVLFLDLLDRLFIIRVMLLTAFVLFVRSLFLLWSSVLVVVILLDCLFYLLIRAFDPILYPIIVVYKLVVVGVVDTMLGMESQWQHFESVLAKGLVVFTHVYKHSLLVGQLLVLFELIV